ncbi:hypothetical protein YC2023_045582 [Brassica napus]
MFAKKIGSKLLDVQMIVTVRIIGASPVSNMNFYKLLRSKTHVVLYPGLYVKLCTERDEISFKPLSWVDYIIFVGGLPCSVGSKVAGS